MGPREKQIDLLERDYENAETDSDRKEILREIRDIERDAADEQRWREEGQERGWGW